MDAAKECEREDEDMQTNPVSACHDYYYLNMYRVRFTRRRVFREGYRDLQRHECYVSV